MKKKEMKTEHGNTRPERVNKWVDGAGKQGIVVRIGNKQALVLAEGREEVCLLAGFGENGREAAVGDLAVIEPAGVQQYKLAEIMPRRTELYRGNRRQGNGRQGNKQMGREEGIRIAVNADCLLAVVSAEYLLHQAGYPEMAILAARRAGMGVGLFVSKWDLVKEGAGALLFKKMELYRKTADFVFAGSAREPQPELFQAVRGKSVVVTGDRGCGKTTLIRGILGSGTDTGKKAEYAAGTHTAYLQAGPEGTLLTDTPGFRDFALAHVTQEERENVFPEIAQAAAECRYADCTHTYEEGCRVLEALREKRIERERYDAYQKMGEGEEAAPVKSRRPRADYRQEPCMESFVCRVCGNPVAPEGAGSMHRNHCPKCLCSVHVDNEPGDRASLCRGIMDPVSVWVRKNGEWAVIHRCRLCGALSSNRIAADDNPALLMSIAVKPLAMPPFPLDSLEDGIRAAGGTDGPENGVL